MSVMTVGDLLELLADQDPALPVMIAHQPSWPLAERLAGVAGPAELADEVELEGAPADVDDVVWLVAGGPAWDRSPYAPSEVFAAVPS